MTKSIFNTELTLSINQHYAEDVKSKSKRIRVPIDFGYVNHVRDEDLGSGVKPHNILKYSIQSIRIDVEYLNYMVKISNRFFV